MIYIPKKPPVALLAIKFEELISLFNWFMKSIYLLEISKLPCRELSNITLYQANTLIERLLMLVFLFNSSLI